MPDHRQLYDNYGPRWLLLIGTFLHVFGLMMTSISTKYWHFLLTQGICSPLGASFVFYPALSTTATWFQERRALAFGIVSSGSSLGGLVFPIMLSRLLPSVGFGWTLRICAFFILGMLLVANVAVKSRLAPVVRPVTLNDYVGPFAEIPFLMVTVAAFLGFFAMFIPINYVILQAQQAGVNGELAGYLLAILNGCR